MKKKLVALLLAAMMILSVLPAVASADEDLGVTLGKSDLSSGFQTEFMSYIVPAGESVSISFKHYSPTEGDNAWLTFGAILESCSATPVRYAICNPNGACRDAAWANIDAVAHEGDLIVDGSFKEFMNNSNVTVTVTNHNTTADVNIQVQKDSVTKYTKMSGIPITDGDLRVTFTVENAYMTNMTYSLGNTVGYPDFNTGYLGAKSPAWEVKPGHQKTITVRNFSKRAENYNNIIVGLGSAIGVDYGYNVRLDHCINPWDGALNVDTNKESNWNWDSFRNDVHGASITVTVKNYGESAEVLMDIVKGEVTHFQNYKNLPLNDQGDLVFWLSVDGAYLTYTDEPVDSICVPTAQASLTLTDEVGLNFILSGPIDGYTVELDGEKSTVALDENGQYIVTKAVAAKDFDQLVQLKLFDKNENQVDVYCSGVPMSVVQNSVELMCEAYENGDGIDSDVKAVAKAMRVYSSYAHNYFFPNDQVDLGQDAVTNANDEAIKAFTITQPAEGDVKAKSMSLTLRGKTIMTVNLSDGTTKEITDIEPKYLVSAMDVDAGNNNVVSVAPMYYGSLVLNYMTEDTALCNVVRALYAYAMACAEYHSK